MPQCTLRDGYETPFPCSEVPWRALQPAHTQPLMFMTKFQSEILLLVLPMRPKLEHLSVAPSRRVP
jgi:hypothetical protein